MTDTIMSLSLDSIRYNIVELFRLASLSFFAYLCCTHERTIVFVESGSHCTSTRVNEYMISLCEPRAGKFMVLPFLSIVKSFRTRNIRAVAAMGEILYLLIWKSTLLRHVSRRASQATHCSG
jgi:hypothetical protein